MRLAALPALFITVLMPLGALAQDGGDPDGDELDAGEFDPDAGEFDADAGELDAGFDPEDDAGQPAPADAGPVDCSLRCDVNVLRYCDAVTGEALSIDCDELEGRCGLLSSAWGLDCLLPMDAPCSSGYAEGASRCDPAGPLYCNMNTCQATPGDDAVPPLPGDAGGLGETVDENPHPLACLGCSNDNSPIDFSFLGLVLGLGLRQWRRRTQKRLAASA